MSWLGGWHWESFLKQEYGDLQTYYYPTFQNTYTKDKREGKKRGTDGKIPDLTKICNELIQHKDLEFA